MPKTTRCFACRCGDPRNCPALRFGADAGALKIVARVAGDLFVRMVKRSADFPPVMETLAALISTKAERLRALITQLANAGHRQ